MEEIISRIDRLIISHTERTGKIFFRKSLVLMFPLKNLLLILNTIRLLYIASNLELQNILFRMKRVCMSS